MLKKRIISSVCGIPLLIAAVWFDHPLPWFTVLIVIWGLAAAFEFFRLAKSTVTPLLTGFGLVWVLLFILRPYCDHYLVVPSLLTSAVVLPTLWLLIYRKREGAVIGWAWTVAGVLYIGWLLSHLVAIRGLEDGRNWVFLALFDTMASDSAAFFVGRALGRHLLAPRISPNKTWEGTIGGIAGAIVISILFLLETPFNLPLSYIQAILLGLFISIFGQLGDLLESLLKRGMGAKDSGKLVPGHGGALDRLDSLIFAGAFVYYYLLFTGGV